MLNEDAELLRQFIPEARDLLEQAGSGLLTAEQNPAAREGAFIGVFRAMHALRGTSGLFSVAPITRVLGAAEDLLSAYRASQAPFPSEAVSLLLESFGQIGQWIDCLEKMDALPGDASEASETLAARIRGIGPSGDTTTGGQAIAEDVGAWCAALDDADKSKCRPAGDTESLVAIEFRPDRESIAQGEDLASLIRNVPGLRWLRADPDDAPEAVEGDLVLRAIAATTVAEARDAFGAAADRARIGTLSSDWPGAARAEAASGSLRDIVRAQCELLGAEGGTSLAERVSTAEGALREALRRSGLHDTTAELLSQCAAASLSEANPAPLLAFCAEILERGATASPAEPEAPDAQPVEDCPAEPFSLTVEQGHVDALMALMGEFVVARNGFAQLASRLDRVRRIGEPGEKDECLGAMSREMRLQRAQFDRLAEDMRTAVMALRMCPVSQLFRRLPGFVQDQARALNKEVALIVEGGHIEADKDILEALADPLVQMIRNRLDQGYELPEERLAAGKPRQGSLRLTAARQGETVILDLIDDGRGIDPEWSDGIRGAIEKTGGQISLQSKAGQGTIVRLSLPPTLAVTRIMAVEAGGGRLFGIPMGMIAETVRIPRDSIRKARNAELFTLRDAVVPLVRLNRMLDLPLGPPREDDAVLVVMMGGERFGIAVDGFREIMDVIVKPMEGPLAELRGFSGTTFLGDGRVLLILDPRELM